MNALNLLLLLSTNSSAVSRAKFNVAVNEVNLNYYNPTGLVTEIRPNIQIGDEFDRTKRLKVVIHGWRANKNHVSIQPIVKSYLIQNDANLLVADWHNASFFFYTDSRNLVPAIGRRIAQTLQTFLDQFNIDVDRVHVVGHSLGAHIAGVVGKHFNGQLGRITGLDPAGPLFGLANADHIRPTDAQFVDIIHTGAGTLGNKVPCGHVDFFPNGGVAPQPGCETLDAITVFQCSHFRAPMFFAESILLPKLYQAYPCAVRQIDGERTANRCRQQMRSTNGGGGRGDMLLMGEPTSSRARGVYYLETFNVPPYGKSGLGDLRYNRI